MEGPSHTHNLQSISLKIIQCQNRSWSLYLHSSLPSVKSPHRNLSNCLKHKSRLVTCHCGVSNLFMTPYFTYRGKSLIKAPQIIGMLDLVDFSLHSFPPSLVSRRPGLPSVPLSAKLMAALGPLSWPAPALIQLVAGLQLRPCPHGGRPSPPTLRQQPLTPALPSLPSHPNFSSLYLSPPEIARFAHVAIYCVSSYLKANSVKARTMSDLSTAHAWLQ